MYAMVGAQGLGLGVWGLGLLVESYGGNHLARRVALKCESAFLRLLLLILLLELKKFQLLKLINQCSEFLSVWVFWAQNARPERLQTSERLRTSEPRRLPNPKP